MRYLTILLFFTTLIHTQQSNAQNYADSLNIELKDYLQSSELPGFSVLIAARGKIVYQKGFGYANVEDKRAFNPQTVQNIGSVSKTFVAVAIMKAIELNYFTLDTDINDILPFKVVNPYHPDEVIRVRDLSTHTSGIIDNETMFNRTYRFRKLDNLNDTLAEFMKEHKYTSDLQDTTLNTFLPAYLSPEGALYSNKNFYNSKPGKRASYSNTGSALAAYLIEVKSGMSFADFSEKYTLKPLKMTHSGWFLTDKNLKQQAVPYFNKRMPLPYYELTTYPDGGLRTSVSDLGKYVLEMISALNGNSKILTQSSVETMFQPVFNFSTLPENMSLKTRNKGVFWNIYNDGYIGHDGDDPGVISNVLFNKDVGIVFLGNMYLEDRSEVVKILKKYAEKMVEDIK